MIKKCWICLGTVLTGIVFCLPLIAYATEPPPGKIYAKPEPELPEFKSETPPKGFTLPEVPDTIRRLPSDPIFTLKGVLFEGNTIFSDQELSDVAAGFLNRSVSMEDLEELRHRLTRFYIDKGYINSGAVIKTGQKVDDGRLIYQIIEGRLDEIRVNGSGRLKPDYISKRIWPDDDRTFNISDLQERFQILLRDPLIRQMHGRIIPGEKSGQGVLELDVIREKPYELSLGVDNHSAPGIGSEQATAQGVLRNLTGYGDALGLDLGHTQGDDEVTAQFSFPLNRYDTMLAIGYSQSENEVVEAPLDAIDVESRLKKQWIELTHPVYRSLDIQFDLGLTLETQENSTSLLGIPFSFSSGYESGEAKMSVFRFVQSFRYRGVNQAFVLRSSLNLGVGLFGATVHSQDLPDSEFTSWLGQTQYALRLSDRLGQVIFKGYTQLASEPLLTMEQLALGGASTVRGYRENQLVRDNGAGLSLEWQIPLWTGKPNQNQKVRQLLLAPFIDYGKAWDKGESSQTQSIWSAGAGLLWHGPRVNAEIYYGHGFDAVESGSEYDLQDDGIHFQVKVTLF